VRGFVLAAVGVVVCAAALVVWARSRPGYDPYGWLVWGHQTLHLNLNTDGAPSWKPLPFLFTVPFALAGRAQLWLWMVTSVAISLSGCVFAGRIAYRLTGDGAHRWAAFVAAAIAAVGVLGINDYVHYVLTVQSDPMIVALCLGAIDAHLSGKPRLAFVVGLLAALGRPEAWPLILVYGIWCARAVPRTRALVVVGLCSIPALWFGIPALSARSAFISSDLAFHSQRALYTDQVSGVLTRFLGLYSTPLEILAVLAVTYAVVVRDRTLLVLAGGAITWVVVEIAFVLHGFGANPRYLFEPAAVMVVICAVAVGRLLAAASARGLVARLAGIALVAGFVGTLAPAAVSRVRAERADIALYRDRTRQIDRLEAAIRRLGGPRRVRQCGQPVTSVGLQSVVAWELEMNVGNVGFHPGRSIRAGTPIVLFLPREHGWKIRPVHTLPGELAACAGMRTDTELS
jgi:hypothetical protein